MKTKQTYVVLALAILLLGGPAHSQDAGTESTGSKSLEELASERRTRPLTELSADEHQIFIYERETLRAIKSGNVDQLMDLFISENAIVCPPGGEAIIGRDKQRVLFKQWLATKGVVLDYEPVDVHVGPSGDMAYAYGLVRWKNPGEPQYLGKYVSVWVKEDGRWMNHVEMRNVIHEEQLK